MFQLLAKRAHTFLVAAGEVQFLRRKIELVLRHRLCPAPESSSFSTRLISRSIDDAMVGGVDGDADAPAAGELLAACA